MREAGLFNPLCSYTSFAHGVLAGIALPMGTNFYAHNFFFGASARLINIFRNKVRPSY
jgi:hypothetical protein